MRGLNPALIIFHPSRLRAVSQGKFGPLAAFVLYTQRKRAGRQRHSSYLQGAAAGRRAAPVSAGRAVPCSGQTSACFPPRGRQGRTEPRGTSPPSGRLRAPAGPPRGAATGRRGAALPPASLHSDRCRGARPAAQRRAPPHDGVARRGGAGQGGAGRSRPARRGEARRVAAHRGGPRAAGRSVLTLHSSRPPRRRPLLAAATHWPPPRRRRPMSCCRRRRPLEACGGGRSPPAKRARRSPPCTCRPLGRRAPVAERSGGEAAAGARGSGGRRPLASPPLPRFGAWGSALCWRRSPHRLLPIVS